MFVAFLDIFSTDYFIVFQLAKLGGEDFFCSFGSFAAELAETQRPGFESVD